MPSRSNAHPSGSVTSSNRRPLSGWRPVKHSPCLPTGSSPPSRQFGHVVHRSGRAGTSTARARRSARAHGAASASARAPAAGEHAPARRAPGGSFARPAGSGASSPNGRRRAAGCRPSECYGSFCSTGASFRGLSPAPSHHLGVDVFVGIEFGLASLRRRALVRPWVLPCSHTSLDLLEGQVGAEASPVA